MAEAGEQRPGTAPLSARARLRAALIAFFVFFNVLAAVPTFGTPSAERLERPFEQQELRRWSALFRSLGIDLSPERLARGYLALIGSFARARELALTPIAGWLSFTQTQQTWSLFGTPDQVRSALRVSVSVAGQDAVLYESGNPERRWNAARLEYRRIRAAYNPLRSGPPPTYELLGERLGQQIFAARPEVESVRIAILQSHISVPGDASDPVSGEPAEQHVLEFSRPPE